MEKNKFEKWKGKYCQCKAINFEEDMRLFSEGKVFLKHQGIKFASMSKEEYNIYNSWTKIGAQRTFFHL